MSTTPCTVGGKDSSMASRRDSEIPPIPLTEYRLYKRRFSGLVGFIILGIVTGMQWAWFGPIANTTANDFHISVTEVNWLGNIMACIYLPASIFIPLICSRYGVRRCADAGGVMLLISAWVRYAGTSTSLSPQAAYALLMLGQVFAGFAQPVFQVLGPMYSERWFDLNGRTTATMLIAIANPIGSALGQLLSPLVGSTRQSILVLGIISTAAVPAVFLIADSPPLPPTYAGSKPPLPLSCLCRAILGLPVSEEAYIAPRERLDFIIITIIFGSLVGSSISMSVLSEEWFQPAGYSDAISGLLGATLLLAGIVAAVVSAPLFDRVFTHRIGATLKILVPIVSAAWLSLIWAVQPNNLAVLFVIMAIIGIGLMTMLPIALELGVELTRNADGSSSILWFSGNAFSIAFILAEGALRAPSTANPPYNMQNALILNGCTISAAGLLVFFLHGKQARREADEIMIRNSVYMGDATFNAGALEEGILKRASCLKEPIEEADESMDKKEKDTKVSDDHREDKGREQSTSQRESEKKDMDD